MSLGVSHVSGLRYIHKESGFKITPVSLCIKTNPAEKNFGERSLFLKLCVLFLILFFFLFLFFVITNVGVNGIFGSWSDIVSQVVLLHVGF